MFITGLKALIASDQISNERIWNITLTNGSIEQARILSFNEQEGYVIVEEWYGDAKADDFDTICINADHIVMVELHKVKA